MSNISCVKNIVATRSFERSIKKLCAKHENKVLREIHDTVMKLATFQISSQKSNHPLKNAEGHMDIHIAGGKLILLYRYDEVDDMVSNGIEPDNESSGEITYVLSISLRLQDVVNHTQLNNYSKYKAPAREYVPKKIVSSTENLQDISYDEFMSWYQSLSDEEQWDVDDIADTYGLPFYEDCTSAEFSYLKEQFYIFKKDRLPHNHLTFDEGV